VKGGKVVELYTDQLVAIVEEELLYGHVCGSHMPVTLEVVF